MSKISVVLPILVPSAFLRAMTVFAITALRVHADDPDFELIVVEADGQYFDPSNFGGVSISCLKWIDRYLNFTPKVGGVKELNAGVRAATREFVLSTGNDVIAPPHWDTELLRCFEERKDCGVASLSAMEPGALIGPQARMDRIVEGMYSPFMMFRAGREFDESYVKIYQDSDFILQTYEQGQRAYRSCRAHVHHLLRMTSDRVEPEQHRKDLARDEKLFYERWGNSPLMMFAMIRYGQYAYGQEHQSFTNEIPRHY
jgi:hypothetical protein